MPGEWQPRPIGRSQDHLPAPHTRVPGLARPPHRHRRQRYAPAHLAPARPAQAIQAGVHPVHDGDLEVIGHPADRLPAVLSYEIVMSGCSFAPVRPVLRGYAAPAAGVPLGHHLGRDPRLVAGERGVGHDRRIRLARTVSAGLKLAVGELGDADAARGPIGVSWATLRAATAARRESWLNASPEGQRLLISFAGWMGWPNGN
jgi:hypothetical protein